MNERCGNNGVSVEVKSVPNMAEVTDVVTKGAS